MSEKKTIQKTKILNISELHKIAFPDHSISLADLRKVAYAEKMGKEYRQELATHIRDCDYCQGQLAILRQIDRVLTGEEDQHVRVLIEAAESPLVAKGVEARAKKALAAVIGGSSSHHHSKGRGSRS